MRLWYRDRLQKAVLATFTGTFAYAFSLLRRIEEDSVPHLGVTLSGGAVAVSLLLLLIYLNRFTHNLRPVAIADIVGRLGEKVMLHGTEHIRRAAAPDGTPVPPAGPAGYGRPRLVVPGRGWDDHLQLGVTEIREYGATSLQVCRRLRALLQDLLQTQPAERLPAIRAELTLLDEAVRRTFTDPLRRADARTPDRQGIGSGRRPQA
ncbi:DUF2254 family protein [Streptomyces xanthophaeus]|uniref:DUF2254 family protein n=1 Tax=Streptomyces xanthophaeus TaxID=67385 RepID=UPI00343BB81A